MRVVNLRDAIILSMLKQGERKGRELEAAIGRQKKIASTSLSFLRRSGLIKKKK